MHLVLACREMRIEDRFLKRFWDWKKKDIWERWKEGRERGDDTH